MKSLKIATAASSQPQFQQAIDDAATELKQQIPSPDLLIAYHSQSGNDPLLSHLLSQHFPDSQILGASSCQGVMTGQGLFGGDQFGIGLWALEDSQGAYGVGFSDSGFNVPEAAIFALEQALNQASVEGRDPALVMVHATPGSEESIISAINTYFSGQVPIVGGSSADDHIEGHWHCMANNRSGAEAVAVAVFYPSTPIGFSFQSGYSATATTGVVTKACERTVLEIDGQPAAEVYNRWLGGRLDQQLAAAQEQVILNLTTLSPLGRPVSDNPESPCYLLIHPERITADRGVTMFAQVKEGEQLVLMEGTVDSLIGGAGQVSDNAKRALPGGDKVAGGLVIYCAGCRLSVGDQMPQVVEALNQSFAGQPFIGAFTFGEQGCLAAAENRHGNLMISTVVFSSR